MVIIELTGLSKDWQLLNLCNGNINNLMNSKTDAYFVIILVEILETEGQKLRLTSNNWHIEDSEKAFC